VKLGELELFSINDGTFRLDGGSMFGIVPKSLWSKIDPSDERNRILLSMRPLLIRTGSRNILVDTGLGQGRDRDEKFKDLYDINCGNLLSELDALGAPAEKIDTVILTHLHFDHSGGVVRTGSSGTLLPAFPNARYVVQRGEWEDAHAANELTKASYLTEELDVIEAAGQLELIEGDTGVAPGVRTDVTGGHTRTHQIVVVESGGGTCVYWADLIPTAAHVNMAYIMSYDLYPLDTLAQKRIWLDRATKGDWISCFEHDPRVSFARLKRGKKRINVEKLD